jgi:hypothetical protein
MNIVLEVNDHYLWIDYSLDGYEVLRCEDAEGNPATMCRQYCHGAIESALQAKLKEIGNRENAAMQDRNAEMNEYARTNGGW